MNEKYLETIKAHIPFRPQINYQKTRCKESETTMMELDVMEKQAIAE